MKSYSLKRKALAYGDSQFKRAKGILRAREQLALRPAYGPRRVPRPPRFPAYFGDQPQRKFAKLRYCVHETLAGPAVGTIVVKQYKANGMYDPEVGIGGHQPYGYDQLMASYHHYTVLKSSIEVELQNVTLANNIVAVLSLNSAAGEVAAVYADGGINAVREQNTVSKDLMTSVYSSYQQQNRNQRLYFDASKFFGKSPWNLIGDSRFQGESTTDPPEDAYFSLTLYSPTGAAEEGHNFTWKITINYFACFTEPRRFVAS